MSDLEELAQKRRYFVVVARDVTSDSVARRLQELSEAAGILTPGGAHFGDRRRGAASVGGP